jgi:hypothetical protein
MAKRITLYTISLILLLTTLLGFVPAKEVKAVEYDNWNHVIPFTVTDTSGVARTNVPVIITYDTNGKLVAYGLVNATATDTYVDSSGASNSPIGSGTAYDYLMASGNITAIIPNLPAYGSVTLNLYTGYSPNQTSFPIITGNDGYITTIDDNDLEISNNGTIALTDAWIDTTAGADKIIFNKSAAIKTYVSPTVSENITSDIYGSKADGTGFPIIDSTSNSTGTATTTIAVTLPTGYSAGDLLIAVISTYNAVAYPTFTLPSGWTQLFTKQYVNYADHEAYYKVATGTESTTANWITSVNVAYSTVTLRIDKDSYMGVPVAGVATNGNSTNPDPPSLTSGFGAVDTLWLATVGHSVATTAPPTSYISDNSSGTTNYFTYVASRNRTIATEDPGVFTALTGNWRSNTIAIQGVGVTASVSATGISSGEHDVEVGMDSPFYGIAVDTPLVLPVTANLVLNAPLGQEDLNSSPFTTIDSNAHSCTVTGAIWGPDGRLFDGDDYIDCGKPSAFDLQGALTIAAWVNPTAFGATGTILSDFSAGTTNSQHTFRVLSTGYINFAQEKVGGGNVLVSGTTQLLTAGAWNYVVVTRASATGTITLYLNGVADATTGTSTVASIPTLASSGNTTIGRLGSNALQYFNGTIGEVMVYSKDFTPSEILQNYNATKSKYTSGDIYTYSTLSTVPDDGNDWIWGQNNVMPYCGEITIEVAGASVLQYAPNAMISGTTLPDRDADGGDNDGVITWGTNSDMTVTGGSIMDSESATSVGVTSAMMQGELFYIGTYASVYISFQYGLDGNYGYSTSETSAASEQTLSVTLTGLTPNTTYHYRAVARSGVVYSYGADTTFTTMYSTSSAGSTTPLIQKAGVFSGYKTTGDWLFTAEIVLTYPPYYPSGTPSQYFQMQLVGLDGTTILGASPIKQWGDRPSSIYLNSSANITNQAAYQIRVTNISSENITLSTSYTLIGGDWRGSDLEELDWWCIGAAKSMEINDGMTLTDPYTSSTTPYGLIITNTAGGYFTTGIPNIDQVRPNLFGLAKHPMELNDLTDDINYNAGSTAISDKLGASIVADAQTVADVFNVSGDSFLLYMILAVVLFCVMYVVGQTQGFGALGAAILTVPIVAASVYFNIVSISLMVIIAAFFAIAWVRQWWIKST